MSRIIIILLFLSFATCSCIKSDITVSLPKVLANNAGGSSPAPDNTLAEDDNYNYILSAPDLVQTTSATGKSYFLDYNAQAIFELNTTTGAHTPVFVRSDIPSIIGKGIDNLYICPSQNFGLIQIRNYFDFSLEIFKLDLSNFQITPIVSNDSHPELMSIINARLDSSCENLYILETSSPSLMRLNLASKVSTVLSSNSVGSGPSLFNSPKDLYVDELNNEVFISDAAFFTPFYQGFIFKINMANGDRTLVSNYDVGTGTAFIFRNVLNLEPSSNTHLYAYAEMRIFEVNKATGDRTVIYDDGDIPGFSIFDYGGFSLDPSDNNFAFLNGEFNGPLIYKMNLTGPSGSILASGYTASGPDIIKSSSMAINSNESKIYLTSRYEIGIFEVDTTTGIRTSIANNSIGTGPAFDNESNPQIAITSDDQYLYYLAQSSQHILKVEIATGNRTIVIDNSTLGFPFNDLFVMKLSPNEQYLYFTGRYIAEFYRVNITNGSVEKLADATGTGTGVNLCGPRDFSINKDETKAFIVDCSTTGIVEIDLVTLNRTIKTDASLLTYSLDFNFLHLFTTNDENVFLSGESRSITKINATTGEETYVSDVFTKGKGNSVPSTINSMTTNKDQSYIYVESEGELFKINASSGNRKIISKWFGKVIAS